MGSQPGFRHRIREASDPSAFPGSSTFRALSAVNPSTCHSRLLGYPQTNPEGVPCPHSTSSTSLFCSPMRF